MKLSNYLWLTVVIIGMSAGQVLFKFAGQSIAVAESVIRGFFSPYFIAGVLLYGCVTLLWTWQLSLVDLNRAYPFMASTFVIVPLLGMLVLGETIGSRYWLGIVLIVTGIVVVHSA